MRRARISGTGLHAPGPAIPNAEYNSRYGVDVDAFLRENRNICERHLMTAADATSDLATAAARDAIADAGLTSSDVDLVVVATDTPDYISPPTAVVVQYRLGARNAGAFDVNAACAGFVTAVDLASKYVVADQHINNVLVVGAYGMSKYVDWDDYKVATLFADGAGAVVVSAADRERGAILESTLFADGSYHDYLGIFSGGTRYPISHEAIERKDHLLRFAKKFPPDTNATHWPRLVNKVLDRMGRRADEINHFFFTQINIKSMNEALDALGVPRERSHNVMDRYAYTGSACIGMALADAARQHILRQGDLIMMVGSGGGMAMAALAIEWGYDT
jgi:3-oxoacyl-[acyl-carrier-protein] synthase-3